VTPAHLTPFRAKLSRLGSIRSCDIAIVGAGAAGLATAIFTRRLNSGRSVLLLDGASRPGAKILVSGGSRCNVTNAVVSDADFWGGRRSVIRRVLRAFPVHDTIRFFREIGVALHEEADGKLFPDSERARDVLQALLDETRRTGTTLEAGTRVLDVVHEKNEFRLVTSRGDIRAARLVLATGGQSLPKSGSDGAGFEIARRLGHTIVATTPALVPLLLEDGARAMHRELSGVAQPVELTLQVEGSTSIRLTGALLWTHFGISGPVTLNMSRHWLRARLEDRFSTLTANMCPGQTFEEVDASWTRRAAERPLTTLMTGLSAMIPASVAAAILNRLKLDPDMTLAHFTRDDRRRLTHALTAWPFEVTGSRGYTYAEATAGGLTLGEIDPSSMQSRICPGLFIVGEILDVDGRIGGFNFQWAWSSAHVAATALGKPFRMVSLS
jgi:predicted Rossmann fold flavoprotein